jgi:hypothetical protein
MHIEDCDRNTLGHYPHHLPGYDIAFLPHYDN